ncbi:hypothetical protein ABVF61_20685 [Roseibium sp. HPY-6]|uniref:hypothetical protein n=1 Tax=Roseibium sp. HPY-6 TaxID=3229852 RepID=UPI00338EA2E8
MANEKTSFRKARELGAPDVTELIATVPYLKRLLSKGQVAQLQRVIDAEFLNPVYVKEFRKAIEASVIGRGGNLVAYDPKKKRRAYRILDRRVKVSERDAYVRLDHKKMLTADALTPRTNNPDEADYLLRVRNILNTKGVWLRLRRPYDIRRQDPTLWEFWFSLGIKGDLIETKDAMIDREELLGVTMLGAGYYRSVLTGPVQSKLNRASDRTHTFFENTWDKHQELARNRRAQPIAAFAADVIGGGSLPSQSIWTAPRKYQEKYRGALISGDVVKAQIHMLVTLCLIEQNARMLADYLSRTIDGAEQALAVFQVVEKIIDTFEIVACVTGVGLGYKLAKTAGKRLTRRTAGKSLAKRKAKRRAQNDRLNDLWAEIETKKRQRDPTAIMTDAELAEVRALLKPGSNTLGTMKGGHSSGYGRGYHSYP